MANENMIQKHEDNFLAKIAGETPIDDNPRNSTEFWLNEIAENLPGGGTTVIANPTLAGTEDPLTALQVGDTKYSVGEKLYLHVIRFSTYSQYGCTFVITKNSAPFTETTFAQWLNARGFISGGANPHYPVFMMRTRINSNNIQQSIMCYADGNYVQLQEQSTSFTISNDTITPSVTIDTLNSSQYGGIQDSVSEIN